MFKGNILEFLQWYGYLIFIIAHFFNITIILEKETISNPNNRYFPFLSPNKGSRDLG